MNLDRFARRKFVNLTITVLAGLTIVAVLYPLADLVYTALVQGGTVLFQPGFLTTRVPNPCTVVSCSTVGIGTAIEGSVILVGLAALVSIPIGVLAAIFASEYRTRGIGRAVSFTADVLSGVPSIIVGAFVYGYLVLQYPGLVESVISGSVALAVIMIPIITRTTEEALRTVPEATREAAIALGIAKWKMSLRIVLISALPGVVTGVLLAVMRAAGEAAPLILLTGWSTNWFTSPSLPMGTLPVLIYTYAESNVSNWHSVAWGAALFLLIAILIVNVLSRYTIQRMVTKMTGGS